MSEGSKVVVLDFGSSELKAALAERYSDGRYLIRASHSIPSEGCVVRGRILNLSDTATKVRQLLDELEKECGVTIHRVYAAVGGQSMQSYRHVVEKLFDEPHEVVDEDIASLQAEIGTFAHDQMDVLAEVSPVYYVNGAIVKKPVGVQALSLKASYQLILARQQLADYVDLVLQDKLGLEVVELMMSPIVLGDRFLTEEQKRIGCAMVDFGGACTTVSIYRRGVLEELRVIPLGSQSITGDLTWMHISPSEAERVKREEAFLLQDSKDDTTPIQVKMADMVTPKSLSRLEVNQYVEARTREIVNNVKDTCLLGQSELVLPGGVVISGGGSKLRGLTDLMTRVMGVEVEQVTSLVSSDRSNEYYILNPEWHVIYSMIPYATEDCEASKALSNEEEEEVTTEAPLHYPEDDLSSEDFQGKRASSEPVALFTDEELEEQRSQNGEPPMSPFVGRSKKSSRKKKKEPKESLSQWAKGLFNNILPSDFDEDSYDEN